MRIIDAGTLRVAYVEYGPGDGAPVLLVHGFPYDVHAFDDVACELARAGMRAIVPYVRGYGPTRFRNDATPRSGQQAAIAVDAVALLDALDLPKAVVAGFDWGGRAACIVATLWPERVSAIVSDGYTIQDIDGAGKPAPPEQERRLWYQYYFNTERGRAGLDRNRTELCKLLWQTWSPTWRLVDEAYARTAPSFDNPDFLEVCLHSYRHRYGAVAGDAALEPLERRLARLPDIGVPAITLEGTEDGVTPAGASAHHARKFTAAHENRVLRGIGHNIPQEAPGAFARAVLDAAKLGGAT